MTRVNANGYFDFENSEEQRYEKKKAMNALRTEEFKNGEYSRAGGCLPLPVPEDSPFFVKDYSEYFKILKVVSKMSKILKSKSGWGNRIYRNL